MHNRIRASLVVLAVTAALGAQPPRVRISGWYWLNSAPKAEWARDFRTMQDLGFTDVVLCWGLDAAAFGLRINDTRDAMRWARQASLGAYMVMWHPVHNSLERRPEFVQVDAAGNRLFTFEVFNARWRRTQWKEYLQRVARAYRDEPAMAGYVFDDSFGIGPVGSFGGKASPEGKGIISYSDEAKRMYGAEPPREPRDPDWPKWVKARAAWWEDWARDTVGAIREIDSDPRHEIYLEDEQYVLGEEPRNAVGLDFSRLARHFDAVGAYTAISYDSDSSLKAVQNTRDVIARTRAALGPTKKFIYTFWVANPAEERNPGPARYPTVAQIRAIAEAALAAGVRHLDMYGFRIGEFAVKEADWPAERPGAGPEYKLTGQFPEKFLWDRKSLHAPLRVYLRGLNSR